MPASIILHRKLFLPSSSMWNAMREQETEKVYEEEKG